MVCSTFTFTQFPQYRILATLYTDVSPETLREIKNRLVSGDRKYDFCFLNTKYILSTELLLNSIHKAILNKEFGNMKANTLNTEIIFNLLPTNKIAEAFRSFGVDEACPNVIVIHVSNGGESLELTDQHIATLLGETAKNIAIDDDTLASLVDVSKFKKLYKLNDAATDDSTLVLSRLAIAACHLRGV